MLNNGTMKLNTSHIAVKIAAADIIIRSESGIEYPYLSHTAGIRAVEKDDIVTITDERGTLKTRLKNFLNRTGIISNKDVETPIETMQLVIPSEGVIPTVSIMCGQGEVSVIGANIRALSINTKGANITLSRVNTKFAAIDTTYGNISADMLGNYDTILDSQTGKVAETNVALSNEPRGKFMAKTNSGNITFKNKP